MWPWPNVKPVNMECMATFGKKPQSLILLKLNQKNCTLHVVYELLCFSEFAQRNGSDHSFIQAIWLSNYLPAFWILEFLLWISIDLYILFRVQTPTSKSPSRSFVILWQTFCSNLPPVKRCLELQQWLSGHEWWWWWRSCAWWVLYLWLQLVMLPIQTHIYLLKFPLDRLLRRQTHGKFI